MAQVQAPAQAPSQGVNDGRSQSGMTSLYVGDLDFNVTDLQLYDLFSQVAQVASVRVCRDLSTRRSLGYGYVNYRNPDDAAKALETLNFTSVNERPIRIMYSHRDSTIRKSGAGNIFIKNLDKSVDNKTLHDTFSTFGTILSCKVATDPSGQSKGHGFVQYDNEESAQAAIEKLNGTSINDKQVYVGPFISKQERESTSESVRFNNVYVKNLSESMTEDDLKNIFGEFGPITSVIVMRDADGKTKCFGFVNFENSDDAARAVEALNGKKFDEKEWYVGKAQKKSEREVELRHKYQQHMKEIAENFQKANLYIKNLDDSIDDEKLKELFSRFGIITSCKVLRDLNGISRGSGFVAFSTPHEASMALAEMLGKMVMSKPLYVAHAQRKEDRKARLQAQFSQVRPATMASSIGPHVPMYQPGAPGIGPQLYYGQGHHVYVPQLGFGYQQQLVPGMRPGVAPMTNFVMPMTPQGQQGPRSGGRRAGFVQQSHQPVPVMQQQMVPRGRVYRYLPGRGMPDLQMTGVSGGMMSMPSDMGIMPTRESSPSQPIPIGALASALANATPDQQRMMLGESLYPLVEQLEPHSAAKITGMLLEMDQTEVLHLIESPEALKTKVTEAMEVLRNTAQPQAAAAATDQLGSLSLE
ncbi:hypothetical protein SAY87_017772 [Trapa incisa]|uniref:Polyadenylate-binding protein n=1 Tax=Trapa incisa TaxID=236973 RepID=A0AAN7L2Z1_9MYRT|nr:hypothetical protein SAY87_017772 [Trapa incisa]